MAENVSGMLAPRNADALKGIVDLFRQCGYVVSYKLLNASDFGVPQDRKRVIFVGIRNDLNTEFVFPNSTTSLDEDKITLKDCIYKGSYS